MSGVSGGALKGLQSFLPAVCGWCWGKSDFSAVWTCILMPVFSCGAFLTPNTWPAALSKPCIGLICCMSCMFTFFFPVYCCLAVGIWGKDMIAILPADICFMSCLFSIYYTVMSKFCCFFYFIYTFFVVFEPFCVLHLGKFKKKMLQGQLLQTGRCPWCYISSSSLC